LRVRRTIRQSLFGATLLAGSLILPVTMAQADEPVQFNRDVRPILSDKCFPCHGPDASKRQRDIRFDLKEGLFGKTKAGLDIVVPGKPGESELFRRVIHPDVEDRMPPAEAKKFLTDENIQTLKSWIEQGASWQGHWAFIPPQKPALPQVSNPAWCRNEIDHFILKRLDAAGLSPSTEADKETLLRRVSLDLTGLPPTPSEEAAFLSDTSDSAYEKAVDRLLASPHYGERMAFVWLDAARYSDTNGYQRDTIRTMWPWRDWVINAYNSNMPFDQFAIEQLAGDLLPNATLDQKIATGFNRNHRINGEGGIIPEEYAVEYVVDRVSTTSTAFMGLTMGCARCHDHKFDPFSQKEFYELYAFFDQVPEEGKGREQGNDVPILAVPTPEQTAKQKELGDRVVAQEAALSAPDPRLDAAQAAWEQDLGQKFSALDWQTVDASSLASKNGATLAKNADGSILASGPNPDQDVYTISFVANRNLGALKLDVLTDPSLPQTGPGRCPNGNVVVTGIEVEHAPASSPGTASPLKVVEALADYAQPNGNYSVKNVIDADVASGWATGSFDKRENRTAVFALDGGTQVAAGDLVSVKFHFESQYAQHAFGHFRLSQSASQDVSKWMKYKLGTWHFVGPFKTGPKTNTILETVLPPEEGYDPAKTYGDDNLRWTERTDWADGTVIRFDGTDPAAYYLHRTIQVDIPTTVTLSLGSNDAIKMWVDGKERFVNNIGRRAAADQDKVPVFLEAGEHNLLIKIGNYGGESGYYFRVVDDEGQGLLAMMNLLSLPAEQRSPENKQRLQTIYRERDPEWIAKKIELANSKKELEVLGKSIVTTMIMEDMPTRRDTYRLIRGVYDKPDKSTALFPSVPASLGEMDEALPKNRLGFARWLMDPRHPLTARVQVNLFWQMHFGRGLVKTSEDFGTQGMAPTHSELLDWLAVNFIETGWNVKAMQKQMVMSATYRQSSRLSEPALEKDPANLLLSRAPRVRLAAEMIRDQALAASGLLNPAIGGPSVKPYQPADLWSALTFQNMDEYDTNFYVQDTGEKLYRRGLYTFWKRTILPPHMQIFNAAGREMCSMRQENTNTPMQALAVLNEPTFVEAARSLAQRMILEGGSRSADRVRYGFKLLLAHQPNPQKQQILLGALSDYQSHFNQHQEDAKQFLSVGDSKPNDAIPGPELAAYTMLASVMLNMDEAITRE
jgi:hypothetical protein